MLQDKKISVMIIAIIIISSVFVAMAPISARDENTGDIETGDIVYQGEKALNIATVMGFEYTLYGMSDSTADGEIIAVANSSSFNVPSTAVPGPYNKTAREGTTADLIIKEPTIGIDVLIGTNSVVNGIVPEGELLTIRAKPNFGGLMRDRDDGNISTLDIKLTSPAGVPQDAISINASSTEVDYTWDTTGKTTGTWTVKIATDKTTCNDVDISSENVSFEIRSAPSPTITAFAPPSPVTDTVGNWRTFNVTVNQTVNVSWYLDESLLFTNESVTEAICTLHAAVPGEYNVSALASNANGTDMQTWVWNVPVPPAITHRGGASTPRDSDGDGYSDIEELLAGTNPNDPNDYPGKPVTTPTATTKPAPTGTPTVPVPIPTPTPAPATPEPTPEEEPGFEAVFAIAGLLAVAYILRRRC